jgi:hypothetical protein
VIARGNQDDGGSVERTVKRLRAGWLLVLVMPIVGVVADAGPAAACYCVGVSDADAFARADAVFVGRVSGYDAAGQPGSSTDRATWTFKVRDVYKGKVARRQQTR